MSMPAAGSHRRLRDKASLFHGASAIGREAAKVAGAGRVRDQVDLRVAAAVARKPEADPGGVIAVVALEKDPDRVGRADEVIDACLRPRDIDILQGGRVVILVDPAHADALVAEAR